MRSTRIGRRGALLGLLAVPITACAGTVPVELSPTVARSAAIEPTIRAAVQATLAASAPPTATVPPLPTATIPSAPTAVPTAPPPLPTATPDASARLRAAFASIVRIQSPAGEGTGFAVNRPGGELGIVTNAHVVGSAPELRVIVPWGEAWAATVVARDPIVDLVVLTAPGLPLPPLSLLDRMPEVGDQLSVVGYPLGAQLRGEPTVTRGIVSGRRSVESIEYLQTDAAINPGNSGGPVLTATGQVAGVATMGIRSSGRVTIEGIGFAIPAQRVQALLLRPVERQVAVVPPTATSVPSSIGTPDRLLTEVAARRVTEANQVWATVVASDKAPLADLERVYGGNWLTGVRSEIVAMRARGQYRVARLLSSVEITGVRPLDATGQRYEVLALEHWDDRLYASDGSLACAYPGRVTQRYVFEARNGLWLIVESQLVRA